MPKKDVRTVIREGRFECPSCARQTDFQLIEIRPYFSFASVPLLPAGKPTRLVECQRCEETFPEKVAPPAPGVADETAAQVEETEAERKPPSKERTLGRGLFDTDPDRPKFKVGDRVLGRWDFFWYPGKITAIEKAGFHVAFDEDGDTAVLPVDLVWPLDIKAGERAYCREKSDRRYVPGKVIRIDEKSADLVLDDGRKISATISRLRVVRGNSESPWKKGQRVFAVWPGNNLFYPAIVRGHQDVFVLVKFFDGDRAAVTPDMIFPLDLKTGDLVFVRRRGEADFSPATLRENMGDRFLVAFEKGGEEWTTLERLAKLPPEMEAELMKQKKR